MQIAVVGIGRMGANIVRRLMRAGHKCFVYDINSKSIAPLVSEGAVGAASVKELVAKLTPPRAVWMMLPAAVVDDTIDILSDLLARNDVLIDGGNSHYRHDITRAKALAPKGIHYVDVGTSGGVWGLERGFCGPAHARSWKTCLNRRTWLFALRPERRRTFRQDGAQRHRIRSDGRLCGRL